MTYQNASRFAVGIRPAQDERSTVRQGHEDVFRGDDIAVEIRHMDADAVHKSEEVEIKLVKYERRKSN